MLEGNLNIRKFLIYS